MTFCSQLRLENISRDNRGTRANPKQVHDHPWPFIGPYRVLFPYKKTTICNNFLQGIFARPPYQYESIPYLRNDFYREMALPPYLLQGPFTYLRNFFFLEGIPYLSLVLYLEFPFPKSTLTTLKQINVLFNFVHYYFLIIT